MGKAKWDYGESWEKYPIEDRPWMEMRYGSIVQVQDLFHGLPDYMLAADLIYCDPPWNTSMVNGYYTKAQMPETRSDFKTLMTVFFKRIQQINPRACYIEIGKQGVKEVATRLQAIYPKVEVYDAFYYRTKPCHLVRGGHDVLDFSYNGMEETAMVRAIIENETFECIADICMGRGLTGVEAFRAGKRFVGTELNKRRLACCIDKVAKLGGIWRERE